MSELTKEDIEQMRGVVRKCIFGIPDSEGRVARDTLDKIVDELLSLRTLRDAGDEEVERLRHTIADLGPSLAGEADRLHDIAITRGQRLREAREEIERLKGDAERYRWLRSHSWHEPYHIFFGPGCNQLEPHHLDQAIDNEMKYPIRGEDKPQYEEGDGGYYDLLPGGLDQ